MSRDIRNPRIEITVDAQEYDDIWEIAKLKRTTPQDMIRAFVRTMVEQNPIRKPKERVN